ncbi:MAG: DUF3372 domain-containing protein, partial [Colwellia sp.]|nr:DUF3372 domain-containing protein [Colwellia sp.]
MKKFILHIKAIFLVLLLSACQESTQGEISQQNSVQQELAAIKLLAQGFSAHWLSPQLVLLPKNEQALHYQLVLLTNGGVDGKDNGRTKGNELKQTPMTAVSLAHEWTIRFPHLANFQAYQVDMKNEQAKWWLKGQLLVTGLDKQKTLQWATNVQTGPVIDALYTQGDNDADEVIDLGATIINNPAGEGVSSVVNEAVSFKLWAPTAQAVSVQLFDDNLQAISGGKLAMIEDTNTGVWQVVSDNQASYAYYKYQLSVYHPVSQKIESLSVTDPYSLSLSINSEYSQVVNLNDAVTQPENWLNQHIPTVKNVEDNVFYETHIRDFSANEQRLSDPDFKGKYKAFSEQNSDGIQHLKALQAAGLNNIHLLPTFDIATVNEDESKHLDIDDNLAKVCTITPNASICQQSYDEKQSIKSLLQSFSVAGEKAQQLVSQLREYDNYNWGYDPFHYTVPEGSYAVEAKGVSRLVEFREMVQSLHGMGFRVIMDVVYNHTHQAGLETNAVLDKIVPNYYHRLHPITSAIEQSTCCDNTATERVMMAKLMTDSLIVWARDYIIDGFRFVLMGHQPKDAMLAARAAVRQVDSDTYFYGE